MTDEQKITFDEFREMFGGDIPKEALAFVWNDAPPGMPLAEVRAHLLQMAAKRKPTDEQVARYAAIAAVMTPILAEALAAARRAGFDACKKQAARRLNAAAAEAVEDQLPHCEVIALALREAAEDILRREPNT